jgi:hypothetical protein
MKLFEWKFFPLLIVGFLVLAYMWSNAVFVNCGEGWATCEKIASENMSEVPVFGKNPSVDGKINCDAADTENFRKNHLQCVPNLLTQQKQQLDIKNARAQNQRVKIDSVANRINQINLLLPPEEPKKIVTKAEQKEDTENTETTENLETTTPVKTPPPEAAPQTETIKLKAEKKELSAVLKRDTETLATLEKDAGTTETEIAGTRRLIAERYSKRMLFMFFTAAFLLLCIAAIGISISVIHKALKPFKKASATTMPGDTGTNEKAENTFSTTKEKVTIWQTTTAFKVTVIEFLIRRWQFIAAAAAIGFGLIVYFGQEEKYLSIVIPMYSQSIWSNGDVSKELVHSINCFGFTATVWLVFAGGAVFYAVRSKHDGVIEFINGNKTKLETEKAELEKELEELSKNENADPTNLTTQITNKGAKISALGARLKNKFEANRRQINSILYVGALMLFVGMVRIKLLSEWHLLFVSFDLDNPFYKLLANFFNKSIGIQAAFYSLLLLVIYVPVVYAIPGLMDSQSASGQNFLERLGLPFSSEFMKKFIAIFSPFLAGPIMDFLGALIGKAG